MTNQPRLITLQEAAEKLRIARPRAGRWLKLYVLRREKIVGRNILVRRGAQRIRTHYLVNMSILRRWCPELFDGRDDVIAAAKAIARGMDAKLDQIDERLVDVEAKLAAIAMELRNRPTQKTAGVKSR